MRKLALATLTLAFAPFLFAANDAEHAVLRQVLEAVARSNTHHGFAPAAIRSTTLGGGDSFASEWIMKVRGNVIGDELAKSYVKMNGSSESLVDILPNVTELVDADAPLDWNKIDQALPGKKAVIVFSRPAFDKLGTVALVRADVIPREGVPTTTFYEVARDANEGWKLGHMATMTYTAARNAP